MGGLYTSVGVFVAYFGGSGGVVVVGWLGGLAGGLVSQYAGPLELVEWWEGLSDGVVEMQSASHIPGPGVGCEQGLVGQEIGAFSVADWPQLREWATGGGTGSLSETGADFGMPLPDLEPSVEVGGEHTPGDDYTPGDS